jgi:hypothetical protein
VLRWGSGPNVTKRPQLNGRKPREVAAERSGLGSGTSLARAETLQPRLFSGSINVFVLWMTTERTEHQRNRARDDSLFRIASIMNRSRNKMARVKRQNGRSKAATVPPPTIVVLLCNSVKGDLQDDSASLGLAPWSAAQFGHRSLVPS